MFSRPFFKTIFDGLLGNDKPLFAIFILANGVTQPLAHVNAFEKPTIQQRLAKSATSCLLLRPAVQSTQ